MVMTNIMGQVVAAKRQREGAQAQARAQVGDAMAGAARDIVMAMKEEERRAGEKAVYEEEKQYERTWKEEERQHGRLQKSIDQQNKQHEKQFNLMAKVAQSTGIGPTMKEAAGMGFSPGEQTLLERIAEERSNQIANEEAAHAAKMRGDAAATAESTARAGAHKAKSMKDMTAAGMNVIEGVKSVFGGGGDPILRRQQQAQNAMTERQEQRRRWKEADNAEDKRIEAQKYYRREMSEMNERGESFEDLSMDMLREIGQAASDAGNAKLRDKILSVAREKAKAANAR